MADASILILDDDVDILTLFRMILEKKGYNVVTVSSGREAIKMVKEKKFQVALLDIVLPDIRGDTVAKKIKKIDEGITIIFITGYTKFKDCIKALDIGIHEILLKPISNDELLSTIESALLAI